MDAQKEAKAKPTEGTADQVFDTDLRSQRVRATSLGHYLYRIHQHHRDQDFQVSDIAAREGRHYFRDHLRGCEQLAGIGLLHHESGRYRLSSEVGGLTKVQLLELIHARYNMAGNTLAWRFRITGEELGELKALISEKIRALREGQSLAASAHPVELKLETMRGLLAVERGDKVWDCKYGLGTVKFINGSDNSVSIQFVGGDVRRFSNSELRDIKVLPSDNSSDIFVAEQDALLKSYPETWNKVKSHVHPRAFHTLRDLIREVENGGRLTRDQHTLLETNFEDAKSRQSRSGSSIDGLSVFQMLMIHREITDPALARQVPRALEIFESFGVTHLRKLVETNFIGNQWDPKRVRDIVDGQARYFQEKGADGTEKIELTEEAIRKAVWVVSNDIATIEQLTASLGITESVMATTQAKNDRRATLASELGDYLTEKEFARQVEQEFKAFQQKLDSGATERMAIVSIVRERWEKGEPIHEFRARTDGLQLGHRAREPHVFGSYADALRAAGIPGYFIRETEEGGHFQRHNAGVLAEKNLHLRLRKIVNSEGVIDCKRFAEDRSLFISTYQYYKSLLDAANHATGRSTRVPELPAIEPASIKGAHPPAVTLTRDQIQTVLRRYVRAEFRVDNVESFLQCGTQREPFGFRTEAVGALMKVSLRFPGADRDAELPDIFGILGSREIPLTVRKLLLAEYRSECRSAVEV